MILTAIRRVVVPTLAILSLTLDVLMPAVDGLETLRRLREDDKELPVMNLSCLREAGTIKEAFRCGTTEKLSEQRSQELRIPLLPPPHVRY